MKLIKQSLLFFREGKSDKVYEVDLCELPGGKENSYLVNFRYGRRGTVLREGTKTTDPISLDEAEKVFASVVVSKTNKGYQENEWLAIEADLSHENTDESPEIIAETNRIKSISTIAHDEIEAILIPRIQEEISTHGVEKNQYLRRLIWRAGELRLLKAVPIFESLIGRGNSLQDYCLAWALGRCAEDSSLKIITDLNDSSNIESVKRISFEALLSLSNEVKRKELLEPVIKLLPEAIQSNLLKVEQSQLTEQLISIIEANKPEANSALYKVYMISMSDSLARKALISALAGIPFTPNRFKAIRYIYKAAEFRDDTQVFGLLTAAIERSQSFARTSRDYYSGDVRLPGTWEYVDISKEAAKPNSRIAYTDRTRHYFRKRCWRTLDKLGSAKDEHYVSYARDILITVSDDDGGQAYTASIHRWKDDGTEWGSYDTVHIEYTNFCNWNAFNHILYDNSERYDVDANSGRWYKLNTSIGGDDKREEAYSDLWDQRPDALVKLLCEARSLPVHQFAAKVFSHHSSYWPQVSNIELLKILNQAYADTSKIGLKIARQRYKPETPDIELVKALLGAVLDEARAQAQNWISDSPQMLRRRPDLLISIMTSKYQDVRAWARPIVKAFELADEAKRTLVARLFAYLQGLEVEDSSNKGVIDEVLWYLLTIFPDQTRTIDINIIVDLLNHELLDLNILAGKLLEHHQMPVEQLPANLLQGLINNPNPQIRAIGVGLYGQLPVDILITQLDIVIDYCLSESSEIRLASRPMVKRIIEAKRESGLKIMRSLADGLFRAEPIEGFHADLLHFLTVEMDNLIDAIDKDTVWRLLMARSNAANQFGAHLLQKLAPYQFTVRQWSQLAKNPVVKVREWVWACYREHEETIQQNPIDALRILESRWDDTRSFAIEYFKNQFNENNWNVELMISVCDSVREDVQQFGRQLLTQHFDEGQGAEILMKLSQHPSVNVQLFTSNYLVSYASGNPEYIEKLEPYFTTLLSHVNKARVAKTRVLKFLFEQAMQSSDVAKLVSRIFSRQSVTIVLRDHSAYLLAMRDIHAKYPYIELPIKKRAIELKAGAQEGAKHAV